MTDSELLELAAKAAGYELQHMCDPVESGEHCSEFFHVAGRYWNPLLDDGDALRLAVKLDISPAPNQPFGRTEAWYGRNGLFTREYHGSDQYAATRRAIVRAAAAIGEGMQ